ncbi:MAG: alanyl-tRNA editing protein, partial [Lachnospiraceae bacterium]|nr:alanyl-tRNA editing protein [Lachnospiraceae bacterium]
QSADRGTLMGLPVIDVQIRDGVITHTVGAVDACDAFRVGGTVTGQIDWEFRFRNMQMHSAEHICSGLVHSHFGFANVGFHLSENSATMDYNGELTKEQVEVIETEVNRIIVEGRRIKAWYPSPEELKTLPYRSKKELTGPVRIVEIEGTDLCACCATHVRSTSEIGLFKVVSSERYKGGIRLHYLAGFRALSYFRECMAFLGEAGQILSAKQTDIVPAIRSLSNEVKELRFRLGSMERELADAAIERYFKKCGGEDGKKLAGDAVVFLSGDASVARHALDRMEELFDGTCALFIGQDGSYRYFLERQGGTVTEIGNALKEQLSARGGGKPFSVSGSVQATEEEIRRVLSGFGMN